MPLSAAAQPGQELKAGDVLGAAVAAALLFALPAFLPALALLTFVAPTPLAVLRLRGGAVSASLATLGAFALVAALLSPGQALGFLLLFALPGHLLAHAVARGRGLLQGVVWACGVVAVEIGLVLVSAGPELAQAVADAVRPPAGVPSVDWMELTRDVQAVLSVVYPAVFLIGGALLVLLNAALLRAWLRRIDPALLDAGEFEEFRWPLGLSLVFVAAGGLVFIPGLQPLGYNLLLLVLFAYGLAGLAIVSGVGTRLGVPPLLWLALALLLLWAPVLLVLLGLFDTWFDFRKMAEPPRSDD
jgi:hypothetical protein